MTPDAPLYMKMVTRMPEEGHEFLKNSDRTGAKKLLATRRTT